MTDQPLCYTPRAAADAVGLSESTIRTLIRENTLPGAVLRHRPEEVGFDTRRRPSSVGGQPARRKGHDTMTIRSHGYGLIRRMLFGALVILAAVTVLIVVGVHSLPDTVARLPPPRNPQPPTCPPGHVAINIGGSISCWHIK